MKTTIDILQERVENYKRPYFLRVSTIPNQLKNYHIYKVCVCYFSIGYERVFPLSKQKLISELIESRDYSNMVIAMEIMVKYDINGK